MRLRLFDEEQRQVRVPCFRKLHDDGCDVKKIGVAQAGRNNVFERDAGVSQLETKVTGDVAQCLSGEVEGCGLGANALREIAKGVADLRIDVRDDAVLRWRTSDMRKKSLFLSFKQEVLQKCRNSSRRARTERLARVARRGQENVSDEIACASLWLRRVEATCPQRDPAAHFDGSALIPEAPGRQVSSRIRHRADQQALERVTKTTECAFDREGRVRASTTQVFVLGVTFTPSAQGKRQQADRVDDIRLAAIVFSHEDGHVLAELDRHIGTRTKSLDLERVEMHRQGPNSKRYRSAVLWTLRDTGNAPRESRTIA